MEYLRNHDIKKGVKQVALASSLIAGSLGAGAGIYREVAPPKPEIYSPSFSVAQIEQEETLPTFTPEPQVTPVTTEYDSSPSTFIETSDCFSINSLFSPAMVSRSSCADDEHESLLHEWIKSQPQDVIGQQSIDVTQGPSTTDKSLKDFDPVSFCLRTANNGTTYSGYDDVQKNIESCYGIFHIKPETINPLKTRPERTNYAIFPSSTYQSQESALSHEDDAPNPWERDKDS